MRSPFPSSLTQGVGIQPLSIQHVGASPHTLGLNGSGMVVNMLGLAGHEVPTTISVISTELYHWTQQQPQDSVVTISRAVLQSNFSHRNKCFYMWVLIPQPSFLDQEVMGGSDVMGGSNMMK